MKKIKKGEYGYRDDHKKRRIFIVSLFLLAIAAQLVGRYFITWDDLKNLVTISAILTVLPMANLASPLVASWRFKTAPRALYETCRPYEERFPVLYDLIITSNDLILPIDVAVIHPSGVYMFCSLPTADTKKAEKFLNEMLTGWKLDGNARVITDEKIFLKRLSSLKAVTEEEDDGSAPHVAKLLTSLSM